MRTAKVYVTSRMRLAKHGLATPDINYKIFNTYYVHCTYNHNGLFFIHQIIYCISLKIIYKL